MNEILEITNPCDKWCNAPIEVCERCTLYVSRSDRMKCEKCLREYFVPFDYINNCWCPHDGTKLKRIE